MTREQADWRQAGCEIFPQWFRAPDDFRINPPPGRDTADCLETPTSQSTGSIPAEATVHPYGVFEHDGELFLEVLGSDQGTCWVSERDVERVIGDLRSPRDWLPWQVLRD